MNDIRKVLSYNDVLLCPRHSGLDHVSDANIEYNYGTFSSVPLINSPMDTVCSPKLLKMLHNDFNMPVTIHRWFNNVNEQIKFIIDCDFNFIWNNQENIFISVGNVSKWKEWIDKLIEETTSQGVALMNCSYLVDVANGDTKSAVDTVKYIRSKCNSLIMAGNVATRSGFSRLQDVGANFIRVGIGGGSICSTRLNTGFGIPTLTSVFDCAKIKDTAYLVADGGIESPGDICKAMAVGADMVMAGKMFAATDLSGGKKYNSDFRDVESVMDWRDGFEPKWVQYKGMASRESVEQLKSKKSHVSIEGVSGLIPYTGKTVDIVNEVIGNLRTSLSYYAGCVNWKQFQRRVKMVEISQQGWEESKTRINI